MGGYVYRGNKPLGWTPPKEEKEKYKPKKPDPVWEEWTEVVDGIERHHGNRKGFNQHRKYKDKLCDDCRKWVNAYQKTVPSYLKNKGHKKKESDEQTTRVG